MNQYMSDGLALMERIGGYVLLLALIVCVIKSLMRVNL